MGAITNIDKPKSQFPKWDPYNLLLRPGSGLIPIELISIVDFSSQAWIFDICATFLWLKSSFVMFVSPPVWAMWWECCQQRDGALSRHVQVSYNTGVIPIVWSHTEIPPFLKPGPDLRQFCQLEPNTRTIADILPREGLNGLERPQSVGH